MVLPEGPGKAGRSPDGFAMRICHEEGPGKAGRSPDGFAMRRGPANLKLPLKISKNRKEVFL
ncbi:hypothetical protein C805_02722 [Eubacterium sp. 14-2]|uniref:hypothetical protein n=1 Tax=Eubacterium sp. 14-2 TaxID=1235790 RepID=UPI00033B0A9F|nr:hypothetical protein [Eubacterium sp. 14-2]EOT24510.1 hypothetical protein C805_02722 [Eubacterium sp. 14-2]